MSLPTHRLKIPSRVVEAFGSELELLAALSRCAVNRTVSPWNEDLVDLDVPHDTWELFRGESGGMDLVKLRSMVMLLALDRVARPGDGRQPGTLMIARKETACPYCVKSVVPGTVMVNTSAAGGTRAVHWQCANREKVSYRVTSKFVEGLAWYRKQAVMGWLDKARGRFS